MTRSRRFVDSFWESDFNGTLGFDHLCKRIKDGHRICKDIEEFFKRRAKAEQHYSKDLYSLVKSTDTKEDSGDLGKSWLELKVQTEKIASCHDNAATEYNRLADELSKFTDEIKTQAKQIEDKVKDSHKVKKNAHSKTLDFQRVYGFKCREMKQQDDQYRVANEGVTTALKDLEKLKAKVDKSNEVMEQSDAAYKLALDGLEKARCGWEQDMEDACVVYQLQEEQRIAFLRTALWKCTNIDSLSCVDCDEGCEVVRCCLEKCDIDTDIQEFIETHMTGSARPAPVVYENYFGKLETPRPINGSVSPKRALKPPPSLPSEIKPKVTGQAVYSQPYSQTYMYADVGPPSIEVKYKVTRSYHDALNGVMLRRGDVVKQLEREDDKGMVTVEMDTSGEKAILPKSYLLIT